MPLQNQKRRKLNAEQQIHRILKEGRRGGIQAESASDRQDQADVAPNSSLHRRIHYGDCLSFSLLVPVGNDRVPEQGKTVHADKGRAAQGNVCAHRNLSCFLYSLASLPPRVDREYRNIRRSYVIFDHRFHQVRCNGRILLSVGSSADKKSRTSY